MEDPMTHDRAAPGRRFNLADGMIIIASLAGCFDLSLAHSHLDRQDPPIDHFMMGGPVWRLASLWLGIAAIAWLSIRLRRPRPPLIDLASQPGFSACVAGALILAYRFLNLAVWMAIFGLPHAEELYLRQIRYYGLDVGLAIGCVWLVQAVGRTWRPQPDWLDRTGRVLGVLWIIISLIAGADNAAASLPAWRERISPTQFGPMLHTKITLVPIPAAPGSVGAGNVPQHPASPADPEPPDGVEAGPQDPASPPE